MHRCQGRAEGRADKIQVKHISPVLAEQLPNSREEVGKVKFVYSVLGSKSMDPGLSSVAVDEDGVPKMLDILGWAVNYVPILQAFLADHH